MNGYDPLQKWEKWVATKFMAPPSLVERGRVVMLHCFLDDSGKDSAPSNPYVCMAGYLADLDALTGLIQKWLQLLVKHGISEIHMKDLIPISGQYKNLGWDIPKRDSVLDDFIQVIQETRLTGVGVALEMAAWRKLKKDNPNLNFGNVQQFCLQRILRLIIDRLHVAKRDDKIALVFDTDPEFGANRFNIFCALMGHDDRVRIPGEVARESAMMSPTIPI
jgi:hypothetical protein